MLINSQRTSQGRVQGFHCNLEIYRQHCETNTRLPPLKEKKEIGKHMQDYYFHVALITTV